MDPRWVNNHKWHQIIKKLEPTSWNQQVMYGCVYTSSLCHTKIFRLKFSHFFWMRNVKSGTFWAFARTGKRRENERAYGDPYIFILVTCSTCKGLSFNVASSSELSLECLASNDDMRDNLPWKCLRGERRGKHKKYNIRLIYSTTPYELWSTYIQGDMERIIILCTVCLDLSHLAFCARVLWKIVHFLLKRNKFVFVLWTLW